MKKPFYSDIGNTRDALGLSRPRMEAFEIEAMTILLRNLQRPVRALEWGCGVSSFHYAQRLPYNSSWESVEHDPVWYAEMSESLVKWPVRGLRLNLIPPDKDYGFHEEGSFGNFRSYILFPARQGGKYGLILVDGRARVECMAVGWDLLADDGVMLLHDAQRSEYNAGIPEGCSFVRVSADEPTALRETPSFLFMAKNAAPLRKLLEGLHSLPTVLRIDENLGQPPADAGRILFINTYYTGFINTLYQRYEPLERLPYWQQKRFIQEQCFGDSDFYSAGMIAAGWAADDIIINCQKLQAAWCSDNNFDSNDAMLTLLEQLRRFRPDVVYLQDLGLATTEFLELLRPHTRLIAGQIASPLPPHADLSRIDILFSSFPHFVDEFRRMGKTAWYQPLAFEPRILQRLPQMEQQYAATFVGGISPHHGRGLETLQGIAELVPVDFWGYGAASLPPESTISQRHHGEAWGLEMFATLQESAITLNRHIDVAGDFANNMRLFEATGCGALLITDYRSNLGELFKIGSEVVAYRSPEEAAALVRYYQANPEEAAVIAKAGQQRTLRDHTYTRRMEQTAEILARQLRYGKESGRYPLPASVSSNYRHIAADESTDTLAEGWKDAAIPARQRGLVQRELEQMYAGQIKPHFAALADLIKPFIRDNSSVLELGCASGYYYEILEYLLGKRLDYTGVDYSEPMIAMSRDIYPRPHFFAADGRCLFFADKQFDLVISSCVLLHVPNYREHIEETARVARGWTVVHRTPVCRTRPTRHIAKLAYGVETVEFCFNESELLQHFALQGFEPFGECVISADTESDLYNISYLLKRRA